MEDKDLYCPVHKEKLVLKTARQGKRKGKKFYGCPTWSKTQCNYTIQYDEETKQAIIPKPKPKFWDSIKNKNGKISPFKIVGQILLLPVYLLGMFLASTNKVFSEIRKKGL